MKEIQKKENFNKTLLIKKLRIVNNSEVKNLIKQEFEEPNQYLNVDSNITVGKIYLKLNIK